MFWGLRRKLAAGPRRNSTRQGGTFAHQPHRSKEKQDMGEISELLQNKVGLSPDQAQQAEQVVIEFVRSKVPPEFQGVLNSFLGQGNAQAPAESGGLGSLLGAASSLFGNKG